MIDFLLIFGTRPEAIKLGPVAGALQMLGAQLATVCTGQHTTLLQGTPVETDLRHAVSLGVASDGNVSRWLTAVQPRLQNFIRDVQPGVVVVQGDTMSTHAGALAAQTCSVPVAHVEAGIRSHGLNAPWPEETTRVALAKIATWHYAPTSTAFANLLAEGVNATQIRVTGNTVVSALARYADIRHVHKAPLIVITLHRREIQKADTVRLLVAALRHAAEKRPQLTFVWPVHPALDKLAPVAHLCQGTPNMRVTTPLSYEPFTRLVASAKGVLTDSGGLVEECATLGIPCAILRDTNDRPEAVEAGVAIRHAPNSQGIANAIAWLDHAHAEPSAIFGTPDAALQIAQHLVTLVRRET